MSPGCLTPKIETKFLQTNVLEIIAGGNPKNTELRSTFALNWFKIGHIEDIANLGTTEKVFFEFSPAISSKPPGPRNFILRFLESLHQKKLVRHSGNFDCSTM